MANSNSRAGVLLAGMLLSYGASTLIADTSREPVPFAVPAKLPDVAETLAPSAVRLDGFLGHRVAQNEQHRLLVVDEEPILAGFRKKPGSHPWIGEHAGKWMHAATLAWVYTGDVALRAKLDRVAAELVAAQEPDGYLGTYVPGKRFGLFPEADWDVWSHKYNLLGLLTYHQYTGDAAALVACRKMGDLLIDTFGPSKKSILSAGTHVGMAATSVLEPVVLLYRFTGEERYLNFARYIVESWDEPNGPRVLHTLLTEKQVNRTANGKAYEMLSNLVGLCELARVTGERSYLDAALNAWSDIVSKRLYITGSASQGEHFRGDYDLPNATSAHVAETCVTTTWIQLNSQLLRLTGEARFADELERTFYNHLTAAQHPDGADWCYFTSLDGRKPYDKGINCCHSSGPRGVALIPQHAFLKIHEPDQEALAVCLFDPGEATLTLGGVAVKAVMQSGFPRRGGALIKLGMDRPATFAVKVRVPDWVGPLRAVVNGHGMKAAPHAGWLEIPAREWKSGDRISLSYRLTGRVIRGRHGNAGLAALSWGPFILAYDEKLNEKLPRTASVALAAENGQPEFRPAAGGQLRLQFPVRSARMLTPALATFATFADAGADGGNYRVWLPTSVSASSRMDSMLAEGRESRSREGNIGGSIIDGDPGSHVVTFNGQTAAEDWYAVSLNARVLLARITFAHGQTYHDGGWFDTSAGKPRVQVQRQKDGPWETVGELQDYPATSAGDSAGLQPGQVFGMKLTQPVRALAVRVLGKPASGDNPAQAFSSCGELQAFGE